ncbi:hypothetical protein CYLTODRAFT_471591 [Cylindrobasidium torrendii FP15055 ss-10]|uniref:Uncharacterized protein n=1 Tax=Cylindrobasidium torrendii FP15055 ss-10 TaxID=1314674 RepID=A0A0D7B1K1_9AGAR|nr:hypothetical protein CYLTODRAFT_471591 [Cylindrobasidium torrendii FP15055 ss-10]
MLFVGLSWLYTLCISKHIPSHHPSQSASSQSCLRRSASRIIVTAADAKGLELEPIADAGRSSKNIDRGTSASAASVDNERGKKDDESNVEDNFSACDLFSTSCESEIPLSPDPSQTVRIQETDLAAKSTSNPLKRQSSVEPLSEDTAVRKKPRRKASKKEPKASNVPRAVSHANVSPDLKLVFGFENGPQDKQRALLFTSGKDIHKLRASITLARNNAKIVKLIKPADTIPLPPFSDKVYTVPDMPKKLEMIKHRPCLAIRALEQGLFDWVFHAMPVFMDNARGNSVVVKYRCGLVDCSWRSSTTYKDELMGHFRYGCQKLKELEEKISQANEIGESSEEES